MCLRKFNNWVLWFLLNMLEENIFILFLHTVYNFDTKHWYNFSFIKYYMFLIHYFIITQMTLKTQYAQSNFHEKEARVQFQTFRREHVLSHSGLILYLILHNKLSLIITLYELLWHHRTLHFYISKI